MPLSRNARYIVIPVCEPVLCAASVMISPTGCPSGRGQKIFHVLPSSSEAKISSVEDNIEGASMFCHRHLVSGGWYIRVDECPRNRVHCQICGFCLCCSVECAARCLINVKDGTPCGPIARMRRGVEGMRESPSTSEFRIASESCKPASLSLPVDPARPGDFAYRVLNQHRE